MMLRLRFASLTFALAVAAGGCGSITLGPDAGGAAGSASTGAGGAAGHVSTGGAGTGDGGMTTGAGGDTGVAGSV